MSVQKQSVSFPDTAYSYAKEVVEAGDYSNITAAVSGALAYAKADREREKSPLGAEVHILCRCRRIRGSKLGTDATITLCFIALESYA